MFQSLGGLVGRGMRCSVGDFGRRLTLLCPLSHQVAVRKNDRRLSPAVCWLIYCSPTRQWGIDEKPSVHRQYNKWPIQTSTYSAHEGRPRITVTTLTKRCPLSLLGGRSTYKSNCMWQRGKTLHGMVYVGEDTQPCRQPEGKYVLFSSRDVHNMKNSWINKHVSQKKELHLFLIILSNKQTSKHSWMKEILLKLSYVAVCLLEIFISCQTSCKKNNKTTF